MKLIMLSGFLGAGKTSCVASLVNFLSRQQQESEIKLAIIENEVAEVGVDNQLLSKSGLEVRTLAAGCICCTLNNDLIATLDQLDKEYAPEYVIFEPSGVANPIRIWESLKEYQTSVHWSRQITVVDAARWAKIRRVMPELSVSQVEQADALFLNKCDLAGNDCTQMVEQELLQLCSADRIYRTKASEGISDVVWKEVLG